MITIGPVQKSDHPIILRLTAELFGDGYIRADEINDRYLVARVGGKFVGWVNTDIWDDEDATGNDGFSLGLIETVAVDPGYRGLNFGKILVGAATAHLLCDGADRIECYATTWSDTGLCYMKGALESNGFVESTFYPQMWKDEEQDYICAACKKQPCLCDATLYVRA